MDSFDVKEFAKMFDAALASNNPAARKALKNFMMVAAVVFSQEEDNNVMGPFSQIFDRLERLEREIVSMRTKTYTDGPSDAYRDYYGRIYGTNPTWIYNPTTSIANTSGTTYSAVSTLDVAKISDILKDLDIK